MTEPVRVRNNESKYFSINTDVSIVGMNGCTSVLIVNEYGGFAMHYSKHIILNSKLFEEIDSEKIGELNKCLIIYSKNDISNPKEYINSLEKIILGAIGKNGKRVLFKNMYYKSISIEKLMLNIEKKGYSEVKFSKEGMISTNLDCLRLNMDFEMIFKKTDDELKEIILYSNTHTNPKIVI